ncbi:MAG TPA: tetratricopeptide repeat protein [Polyangiaceae bacterium]|nr:tetratricopeptide repeat protein [Polyangiaceae bacterium]
MTRARSSAAQAVSPEVFLRKATLARTSGARAKYAQRGLSHCAALDETTRIMLLRQLYLSHMEAREFESALSIAQQMLGGQVMPDVARQDAARACLGLGDTDKAVEHLRIAGRVSPAARRAFHLWTLGTVLYLNGRPRDAVGPLQRALRWGTTDKPLYAAQAALARMASGEAVSDLDYLREQLADAPCGQGYGQFVLGELAFALCDYDEARRYLNAFVRRASTGRVALAVALSGELSRASRLLRMLRGKLRGRGSSD